MRFTTDFKPPAPGEQVGPYRVVAPLARGGHGLLYLAEQEERQYVLKFMDWGVAEARCRREVGLLLLVQDEGHEGIVRIDGHGRWPDVERGIYYVALEHVAGWTLEEWVWEKTPSALWVAHVFLEVARALAQVHRHGVVHQDLKVENIMVRQSTGRPVLVDFGISSLACASPMGMYGMVPTTPEYVSPEAWAFVAQVPPDERVRYEATPLDDMWALGVTLYAVLVGRLPFGYRENPAMVERIRTQEPRPPHVVNPRVPEELSELCLSMLEKDPRRRLPDMVTLSARLEELVREPQGPLARGEPLLPPRNPGQGPQGNGEGEELPEPTPVDAGTIHSCPTFRERPRQERPRARGGWPEPTQPAEAVVLSAAGEQGQARPESTQAPQPPALASPAVPRSRRALKALWGGLLVGSMALAAWVGAQGLVAEELPFLTQGDNRPLASVQGLQTGAGQPGQELAPPPQPVDTGGSAVPDLAPSPAPTPPAMSREKNTKQKRTPASTSLRAAVAVACVAGPLGCTSTPDIPTPADRACPAGSVESMDEMDMTRWGEGGFPRMGSSDRVPVAQGESIEITLYEGLGLPVTTRLTGYVVLDRAQGRAYLRFTQARTPQGRRFPVCVEANGDDDRPGLPAEGGVWAVFDLEARMSGTWGVY
jgi:eukaryotic-like serine/threonine-protein kinase